MVKTVLFPLILLAAMIFLSGCQKSETLIASLDEAKHARIGVMTGSTGEAITIARFPKAQVKSFDDIMDAVAAMKSGQLDAIVTGFPAALQVSKKNRELGLLSEPLDYEDTAIAVRKGNAELLAALNRIIAELKRDGTLESMKQRWFKPDLAPYQELDITLPAEGTPLKIGVSATREPFSFVDKNGRVTGHDGELARIIGAKLQRPVEFFNMKFMALIPALQSGKVDLIVTGMTATEERRKFVDFTVPYYANAQVMLVRKSPAAMVASGKQPDSGRAMTLLERFDGKRIAVLTGSAADLAARNYFTHADFQASINAADAALAVKTRKADAFVMNKAILQKLVRKNPDLEILAEPIAQVELAAAIKKGNTALLAEVNRALDDLKRDGTLDRLRAKWIDSNFVEAPQLEAIDDTQGLGVLKMGTNARSEPMSFQSNNIITGHDIELGRLIALRLGKRLQIIDMNFESLIPALESGKIDIAISNFNVTEERKKRVSFSTPYLLNDISVLVKRLPAAGPEGMDEKPGAEIASTADLKDRRIGVLGGSAGDLAARRHFPDAAFQVFVAAADAALAVKTRKADAFVYDKSVLLNLAQKNPELVILDEPVDKLEVAAALRKDNTALLAEINGVLSALKDEGILQQLRAKWIDSKYAVTPQIGPVGGSAGMDTLRMGTCATIEPFSFQANGKLTGLDIELSRLLGQRLGKKIEIIEMNFEALIPALQSGKIDFALSNFNVTEERKKLVNFSLPYVENDISALVRRRPAAERQPAAEQGARLASVADLRDKRIGVLVGSAHDTYATKNFPEATILQYKTPADVALAVKTGKVDAALFDAEPLREIMRQDDSLGLLGDSLFDFDVGVGFNKDNPALRDRFNQFLAAIKQNGIYRDMVRRWMEQRDMRMPVIENAKTNGVLVVGTSDVGLPFTAVQDNRLVGFDIELCERFAAYLGKEIRLANMDFGSLIAAVSSGRVDLISSSIYVTAERKKQINFSDPYYAMGTNVFALKKNLLAGALQGPQKKLASTADLKDKRIGVLLGSVHDTYAMEHFPNATILQYKSLPDLVLAVKSGKVDAAIYTRETLLEMLRKDHELGLLGDSLLNYPIGIGFNKQNDPLREQFNAFLQQVKSNGDFDDMEKRWIKSGSAVMPKIANTGANGILVVGIVSDKGLPFALVKDGRLIGFDIELAERFGAYLGKKIEYADMEFGSLIAAVASGKIDMIDSTLMLTDERKTRIDFSDPYYELGANVFALRKNLAAYDTGAPAAPETPTFLNRVANSFHSNIIQENRYLLIWDGLKTTVIISIFSTLFGTLLGSLICFMRMSKRKLLNLPARTYINIIRGMPVLVLLMLIFYVVFASVNINPVLVAIIAFGMNFGAYVSEIFRSGIEGIDKGQTEAGIAMGFTKLKTFVFIILPQTVQRILPVYKGEFISLVKMTSIVGYIAVQDLTKASDIIRSRTFDAFFPLVMVAILYFVIAWILMLSLEYLERATDPKHKRRKAAKP